VGNPFIWEVPDQEKKGTVRNPRKQEKKGFFSGKKKKPVPSINSTRSARARDDFLPYPNHYGGKREEGEKSQIPISSRRERKGESPPFSSKEEKKNR